MVEPTKQEIDRKFFFIRRCNELANMAARVGVNIVPPTGVTGLKNGMKLIEQRLYELFEQNGIRDGARVKFDSNHPTYSELEATVEDTEIFWTNLRPMIRVNIDYDPDDLVPAMAYDVVFHSTAHREVDMEKREKLTDELEKRMDNDIYRLHPRKHCWKNAVAF